MVLKPHSREELSISLAEAARTSGRVADVDLSLLSSLLEHKAEDMTATVEAGMTVENLQKTVGRAGQWLALDPANPETLTVETLLACNRSGPRRLGYGTVRDYLIGIKVALASGEIIKAGGKVVKNVAGYDLCKLFIGAKRTLGVIVEATFKLKPLPETETVLQCSFSSIPSLHVAARSLLELAIEPVIMDAHNLGEGYTLVTGFAGSREDVDYQVKQVQELASWKEGNTRYDGEFASKPNAVSSISVLPSKMDEALLKLRGSAFIARYGNGVIYSPDVKKQVIVPQPVLAERLKKAYDPQNIFSEIML